MVNQINALDGNIYLQKSEEIQSGSNGDFDSVFNKISVDERLEDIFTDVAEKTGVNKELLKAVAYAESSFHTDSVSKSGAQGIMQLMPYTSEAYGVTDPFDARQNIMGGATLLSDLLDYFKGNVTLALAGYNAGSNAVTKYGGVPPYEQTVNYVKKINEVLGGALTNDSWTVAENTSPTNMEGMESSATPGDKTVSTAHAYDTDRQIMDFPTVESKKNAYVVTNPYTSQDDDMILSYDDYLYVMDSYREILSKLIDMKESNTSENVDAEISRVVDLINVNTDINNGNNNAYVSTQRATGGVYSDNITQTGIPQNVESYTLYKAMSSNLGPIASKLLKQ